jgi:adenine specific DNA methylase Mod
MWKNYSFHFLRSKKMPEKLQASPKKNQVNEIFRTRSVNGDKEAKRMIKAPKTPLADSV